MRVAAVSWSIREIRNLSQFLDHLTECIERAVAEEAELIVLPESIDLERLVYIGEVDAPDVPRVLAPDFEAVRAHVEALAQSYRVTILGGSHLRRTDDGFVHSAIVAWPAGSVLQDKNVLTQWERDDWRLVAGRGLVMPPYLPLGVNICYDCEFPQAARALAEKGASILAVPAFTESERGFNRVRRSIYARVIENQIFGIHASLVGNLGREPVPQTYGRSAIIAPHVQPFPASGILAETAAGIEDIAVADIDLAMIDKIREHDDVRNWNDRHEGTWQVVDSPMQP